MTSVSNLARNDTFNLPTKIRVYYADSEIGLNCCAKLCMLGYTVILDKYYKNHPKLNKFYNVEFDDPAGSKIHDFVFDNVQENDKLIITKRLEPVLWEYIQDKKISMNNFVDFCIYHWGLSRGNRAIYHSPIYVDIKKINDWDLIKYV